MALEEQLRKWLEIETFPGAEEQIRHASTAGSTITEVVGEESDDSEDSDGDKGNDQYTQVPPTMDEDSADLVLTKRNGRLQVLSWTAWQALYKEQVVAKVPGRERDLRL